MVQGDWDPDYRCQQLVGSVVITLSIKNTSERSWLPQVRFKKKKFAPGVFLHHFYIFEVFLILLFFSISN